MIWWIYFFSAVFIIPSFTGEHQFLRDRAHFKFLFKLSFLPIVLTLVFFTDFEASGHKDLSFVCLIPISVLGLYRLSDNYIRRKLGRPIYFHQRHSASPESKAATAIEFFLQMGIGLLPLGWLGIGQLVFPNC